MSPTRWRRRRKPGAEGRSGRQACHSPWWRSAAIYQVYVRSFADGNGDGIGDLAGVRAQPSLPARPRHRRHLVHARGTRSPMADGGYDVADYRDIDPTFGTLGEAEQLIKEAADARHPGHRRHRPEPLLRSASPGSRRPWRRRPGSPRARSLLVPRRSRRGRRAAAKRLAVHLRRQRLDTHAERRRDAGRVVPPSVRSRAARPQLGQRRGAGGARGRAAVLVRPRRRRRAHRLGRAALQGRRPARLRRGQCDRRRTRSRIATSCTRSTAPGARSPMATPATAILIGEIWLPDPERFARYLRPDEMHTAFNFDFLACPWDAGRLRACIDATLAAHAPVGAPATWVLSNHDVTRHVTRYGAQGHKVRVRGARRATIPDVDLELGTRRARAAALLDAFPAGRRLHLSGRRARAARSRGSPDRGAARTRCSSVRTGEIPAATAAGCRSHGTASEPPFGFSRVGASAEPWLPQPSSWGELTAERQAGLEASMLSLYRDALRIRRSEPELARRAVAMAKCPIWGARLCPRRWFPVRPEPVRLARRTARARGPASCERPPRERSAPLGHCGLAPQFRLKVVFLQGNEKYLH